jgi:putative ATP-dependent endonuclease of OLD family
MTTHSATAISAANKATLWYVDAKQVIGCLPRAKISRQQIRDPETFLARLTIVAEGEAEKGFVRSLLERAIGASLYDYGILVTDGQGHDTSIDLLEALSEGGLQFGCFVDNEGRHPQRWKALKAKLGSLHFQWPAGCLEENVVKHLATAQLRTLIEDPSDQHTGDRLRTLAERLGISDKRFETISAKAADLPALIIAAALGRIPADKSSASEAEKKALKAHAKQWFHSYDGGTELAQKMFTLGVWPKVKAQLLPFVNAVRSAVTLPALTDSP